MSDRFDAERALARSEQLWEEELVPALTEYIRIPNRSPAFDADWARAGHMDRAVELARAFCEKQSLPKMHVEIVRLEGRTPVLWVETEGGGEGTVLLYGHLDKQPEMTGWSEGLDPWTPVRRGDRLYGRGGADDGYAVFASMTALKILQEQGVRYGRCVLLIECCEESGSYDLPAYLEALLPRIGTPELVICLDSGCANYEQLWMTTSLRGMIAGTLRVQVLDEGVHSGDASGIVPSSFRIARMLLSRIEDEATGRVLLPELYTEIPQARVAQARAASEVIGDEVFSKFPWTAGTRPMHEVREELVLNRTWRPSVSVTGAEGLPSLDRAGNVLRPYTSLKLSVRIPPRVDPKQALAALTRTLEQDPPYGARVRFDGDKASVGWDAPALAPWLERAVHTASEQFFGRPAMAMGEGGTIPFMGMLGERFPDAQFVITGVLGPHSNAHGPNEFLHIPMGKKLTACVASIVAAHEAVAAGRAPKG